MSEPLVLKLTSFSPYGEERTRSVAVPPTHQGQQNISFAGWDLVVLDDGTLIIERDSAVTGAVALKPKAVTVGDTCYRVTLTPYFVDSVGRERPQF